ncbi:hypothetical protein [Providencia sp.]|uniref:hypothetical protein n=1 Tax=Providencia sp. TaxID=589 RepID=UPI0025ED87F4|nr:hypothetical protein [Providencia sp.]
MSLALFTAFFSHVPKADSFNNVIDDFDAYLQLEKEGKLQEQQQPQSPVNTQAQGYDIFSSLSKVPAPKEKSKSTAAQKRANSKTTGNSKSGLAATANADGNTGKGQPVEPEKTTLSEVCTLTEGKYPSQSVLLSSFPYLFQSDQWTPRYLAKDFAKYQVVLDPLGLYSSKFINKPVVDSAVYLAQLVELIEHQRLTNLYQFGLAQGVGQLIAYNQLLTDDQLVSKLINHNKSIAELSHIITEKQFEINKLTDEVELNKDQIAQLQSQLSSTEDKAIIDDLNRKLAAAEKTIEQRQNSLTELSQENQQTQEIVAQLEKQLNESIVEQSKIKQQLAEKDKQFADASLKIDQLTAEITTLELAAKEQLLRSGDTDEQVKLVTTDLLKKQELLKQKEDELVLTQKQKNEIQIALKEQQNTAKQLEAKNVQLTAQLTEKAQQADKIQAALTAQTAKVADKAALEAELASAKQQLQAHQTAQDTLSKQFVDSQKQQQQLQTALTQNEQNYAAAQKQLAQANVDLQKLQKDVEKQTALMSQASDQQVKALTDDLHKQIALLKQKEDGLKQAEANSQTTREALAKQQADAKALAEKNQQLTAQLTEKAQQADKIQAALTAQTAKVADKAALEAELASAKQQLQAHQTAQDTLSKQFVDSQKQQQQLQTALTQNEQNYAAAQKQLAQANVDLQKLQKDVEKQTALMSQASDQQVKGLTNDLTKQMALLKQKETALSKLDAEKKMIQESLAVQESEKQQLELKNAQLAKQTEEQEKILSNLKKDIASQTKKQSEVEQQLAEANKQISALKLNTEKLTVVSTNFQTQASELENLKKQLSDKINAESKTQKELALAQDNLKKLKAELDTKPALPNDNTLKSQIMDLNKTIARLQQENESLKSKPASSNKGLAGRVNPKAPSAQDLKQIASENSKRNEKIIEQITQQKYSKLDSNTYYKILQAGSPITNVKNKDITFIMREQLTDGTVTVMYTDKNPVTLPYNELPTPLNSFIEKAGEGGMVKVYIKPEGGYGVQGIPGEVPPNSMSIIDLKIIKAK